MTKQDMAAMGQPCYQVYQRQLRQDGSMNPWTQSMNGETPAATRLYTDGCLLMLRIYSLKP